MPIYEEVLAQARLLNPEEQARLIEELRQWIKNQRPRRSILEFEGIGRGMWDDVGGVDEFLKQERTSWDEYEKYLEEGRNS